MAAVAPLRPDPQPAAPARPRLRVAAPPRRRPSAVGDRVWALTLSVVLGAGVLTVLLLNTGMQTQADRIAATRHRLADLTSRAQVLQAQVDEAGSPSALAARAVQLRLRPATHVKMLAPAAPVRPRKVSARAPGARRGRGG